MIDKTDPTNRDTVPAMLTPGEFVLNKEATEMYGPIIQQMNNNGLQQRFAENKAMEANMGGGVNTYNIGGLVDFLKSHEGYRDKAYQDQAGVWTIGYGRTVNADGSKIKPDQISDKKTEEIFLKDRAEKDYNATVEYGKKYNYNWNDNQINALASFRFNIGNLNELTDNGTRDIATIIKKLPEYNKITVNDEKVISDGLVNRRQAELNLFSNNELPESNQVVTSVRPQTRPKTLQKESQPVVMEQPPTALPNPTGYGGYTPQQFLDEAGRMNTTTVPSMEQAPPMMQEFIAPLPNAGADASFGSAFKEARGRMGAGQVFDYGGKQYTTNFAEEEDMMTANMGGKACSCGKKKVCDCGLSMTYANMGGGIPAQYLNFGDLVRRVISPFYQKEDKKYLGYGTEPYPYDTVATYPSFTAPGDQGIDMGSMTQSNNNTVPNYTPVPSSFNSLQNRAEGLQNNNNVPELQNYTMPTGIPPALLPKVNSDQSILDGSSDSVKDAQRMMMLNNPMPNILPVPDGNPTSLVSPSVDFLPMDESFKGVSIPRSEQDAERMMGINNPMSVPQSVQDSQRMIDINADNGFIPKPNIDVPVEQVSTEAEAAAERISEEISDLRLRMSVMPSGSEMRAILQTQVDQKLGQIASMGQDLNSTTLPVPKQTGVNTGLINAKTELEAANLNLQKAKTPEDIQIAANEIAAAELKVENSATIPEIQTSMITKANTESLQSRRDLLSSIDNQINNSNNPRVIAALNEKRKVIQADIKDLDTDSMLEEGGVNVLGERGRRSPYLQYGDMVQSRVDALEKSTEPEGSSPDNTNNTTTTQTDSESIESLGNQIAKETKNAPQVTEAKGLLSSVFGDLFDSKELMRAAIMYLGGRATGMSGNQALAFAGKTYLAREEANDTAMKKHINKLITDGDYTTASIKLYKETGDIDVLQLKGATYVDLGETKTYYPISGKMKGVAVQARKVKGSDGSIKWQGQNGQFLSLNKYHTDINRSKSRPRSAINAEVAQVEKLFTSLRDDYGTVKTAQGGESAVYRTRLNPRLVGEKTVEWAMSNNIPPYAVGEVLEGAYKRALADAARENKPLIAESIDGYLHSQWIQMSAGDVTDFMTGDEKNPKPIETTAVNEWVGGIKSKVSAVNPKEFEGMNDIVFSTFLRESKLTDSYRNTEANGGISLKDRQRYIRRANAQTPPISGYMLYMQENVAKEYRLLLDKRNQVTS